MTSIIHPGAGILYMKVGTHAREPLGEIIARKKEEIEKDDQGRPIDKWPSLVGEPEEEGDND